MGEYFIGGALKKAIKEVALFPSNLEMKSKWIQSLCCLSSSVMPISAGYSCLKFSMLRNASVMRSSSSLFQPAWTFLMVYWQTCCGERTSLALWAWCSHDCATKSAIRSFCHRLLGVTSIGLSAQVPWAFLSACNSLFSESLLLATTPSMVATFTKSTPLQGSIALFSIINNLLAKFSPLKNFSLWNQENHLINFTSGGSLSTEFIVWMLSHTFWMPSWSWGSLICLSAQIYGKKFKKACDLGPPQFTMSFNALTFLWRHSFVPMGP